ncbi:hypothetical protein ACJJTC_014161 [Scirpophaga incertulas]
MFDRILKSPSIRQYLVVITVNLNVLSVGLSLGWPSPMLVKLRSEDTVLKSPITEEQGSWIVSIGFLVGPFANLLPALLLDKIGRKSCVLLVSVPKIIGAVLLTLATEYWMLLLGRLLANTSDLLMFTIVPLYAMEIASDAIRGSLATILQIVCSLGIVVMLSIGPFASYLTANIIFSTVVIMTMLPVVFLPESPYYLYLKGRSDESIQVLNILRGSETAAKEELKSYAIANPIDSTSKKDLIKNKLFLKTLFYVVILGVGSQLIGFNAVSFYLQTILESTQTTVRPGTASVIIGMIQLVASLITTTITERFKRKTIYIFTMIGMTLGMLGLGTFFFATKDVVNIRGFMNYLPLVSLILVVFCYSAGPGSLNWAVIPELFDSTSRAFGFSISMFVCGLSLFLTTKYFAAVMLAVGPTATYWTLSVNCALYCVFIACFIPETKGKSFVEIQEALGAKKSEVENGK